MNHSLFDSIHRQNWIQLKTVTEVKICHTLSAWAGLSTPSTGIRLSAGFDCASFDPVSISAHVTCQKCLLDFFTLRQKQRHFYRSTFCRAWKAPNYVCNVQKYIFVGLNLILYVGTDGMHRKRVNLELQSMPFSMHVNGIFYTCCDRDLLRWGWEVRRRVVRASCQRARAFSRPFQSQKSRACAACRPRGSAIRHVLARWIRFRSFARFSWLSFQS